MLGGRGLEQLRAGMELKLLREPYLIIFFWFHIIFFRFNIRLRLGAVDLLNVIFCVLFLLNSYNTILVYRLFFAGPGIYLFVALALLRN